MVTYLTQILDEINFDEHSNYPIFPLLFIIVIL